MTMLNFSVVQGWLRAWVAGRRGAPTGLARQAYAGRHGLQAWSGVEASYAAYEHPTFLRRQQNRREAGRARACLHCGGAWRGVAQCSEPQNLFKVSPQHSRP